MILDKNYFNNLTLNYVKKDYYNADDVDNALVEIRKIALEMCAEINSLNLQVKALKNELINEKMVNSELKEIINKTAMRREDATVKAKDEVAQLILQLDEKKKEIERMQIDKEDRLVGIIADVFERMKDEHRENIVEINAQWQNFLTKLAEDDAPQDLSEKVRRIALEMQEISDSMPDFTK